MFSTNFDGTSRGQKNVRMGGKKREQGKAQVLARARLERAAREEERRRQRASETAQRWWRGRRCAAAWRLALRTNWDTQMEQLSQVLRTFEASGVPFQPPVPTLDIFLRKLVAFHRVESRITEAHRVQRMCTLLIQSFKSSSVELNWRLRGLKLLQTESDDFSRWSFVAGQFLKLALYHMHECLKPCEAGEDGALLGDLLSVCSLLLSTQDDSALEQRFSDALFTSTTHLGAPNLFSMVRAAWNALEVGSEPSSANGTTAAAAAAAAQTVLRHTLPLVRGSLTRMLAHRHGVWSSATLECFALELLSYPATTQGAKDFFADLSSSVSPQGWWWLVRACYCALRGADPSEPPPALPGASSLSMASGEQTVLHPSEPKRPRSADGQAAAPASSAPLGGAAATGAALANLRTPLPLRHQWPQSVAPCLVMNLFGLRPVGSTAVADAATGAAATTTPAPGANGDINKASADPTFLVHLLHELSSPLCSWLAAKSLASGSSGVGEPSEAAAAAAEDDEDDVDFGLEQGRSTEATGGTHPAAQGFRGLDVLIARHLRAMLRSTARGDGGGRGGTAADGGSQVPGSAGASRARSPFLGLHSAGSTQSASTASAVFRLMTRSGTVGFLFDAVLAPHPPREASPALLTAQPPTSQLALALAGIYGDWLARTRHRDPQHQCIVQALARVKVDRFLPRLWAALRTQLAGQRACPSWLELPMLLFAAVYSFSLLSLDDTEVFDRGLPFQQAEQLEITVAVRTLLYDLFWDRASSEGADGEPTLSRLQLRACLGRLYNQLYDRHARRGFAHIPREQWLWPEPPSLEVLDPDGPLLGNRKIGMVLTCIPQVIPFQARILRFQHLIEDDQQRLGHSEGGFPFGPSGTNVKVRREAVYEDAMEALNPLGPNLKGRIQVTYESDLGYQEAGIDGGGLFRDFMDALCEQAFDPHHGMFNVTQDQLLYPNPAAPTVQSDSEQHYAFMGRILGKAVYSQILVKPQFTLFFLNKLLNRPNQIDDLYTLDPEMYRNLISLKDIVRSGGNLEDLTLTFSVSRNVYGKAQNRDLVPRGSDIPVDNANFFEYQYRLADFHLNKEIAAQCRAFLRGFHDIIPVDWIRMFDARELQMVIGGTTRNIDVADLRTYTKYAGGYHESQPIIHAFWRVLERFSPEQQADFLKFVTSCSRQPILGFAYLQPPICIQKVPLESGGGIRLPMAATCMNLLKLPEYPDEETLRSKLLYAISANAGFELS